MDISREQLWEDYDSGEVHIRDKLQFELKWEFTPLEGDPENKYIQEFYLFVPNSLQINPSTYTKSQFYLDQTNLVRYKTPEFTFDQLLDRDNPLSPLARILRLCVSADTPFHREQLSDELKLLGNVVRSILRQEVKGLTTLLAASQDIGEYSNFRERVDKLCNAVRQLHERYKEAQDLYLDTWADQTFYRQFLYVDEFIGDVVYHYFTRLLEHLRLNMSEALKSVDDKLCAAILEQKRSAGDPTHEKHGKAGNGQSIEGENYLYRTSMLNKFVLDALQLTTNRFAHEQQYGNWIGALSAGLAMLLYIILFISLGTVFVINSSPFLLLTVIIYMLKDRIKEWLRSFYYLQASRWFPDYTTVIESLDQKSKLGVIEESLSFLDAKQLPKELVTARNAQVNMVLETFQRPENVLFYKRIVKINAPSRTQTSRRHSFSVIFRFNIDQFLRKASDPIERHLSLDPVTRKLYEVKLPKVYHLNLIIRSTNSEAGNEVKTELKKLRLIIDKNGIKRIEQL